MLQLLYIALAHVRLYRGGLPLTSLASVLVFRRPARPTQPGHSYVNVCAKWQWWRFGHSHCLRPGTG